jgi:hypothetical protein
MSEMFCNICKEFHDSTACRTFRQLPVGKKQIPQGPKWCVQGQINCEHHMGKEDFFRCNITGEYLRGYSTCISPGSQQPVKGEPPDDKIFLSEFEKGWQAGRINGIDAAIAAVREIDWLKSVQVGWIIAAIRSVKP